MFNEPVTYVPEHPSPMSSGHTSSRATTAVLVAGGMSYRIGGAYWMPPLFQSEFRPRGIFSFDPSPTLRS
jgi:hypothetical protein